ncbi:MAG: DNA-binding NarL/FixJ family response regulator [Flavobacteriaceae bacterium]|jgi:DNA-binding NarL/FixJ family response regulator|uniref:helix-turn-helix transcriptional regulator n=1 Tax=Candidatus Marifrigoribacter sp. Uisw_064 TaxID=3230970 RepID=UPI003AE1B210
MFKKVIASDDLGSINKGVFSVINELNIADIQQVQYCDDAYLKIKKAALDNVPFDLLITDLSFIRDYRDQTYTSGEELIIALKKEFPNLKIIVYSIEDRLQRVRTLMNTYHVEAYVSKGRKGLFELKEAIINCAKGNTYVSPQLEQALNNKSDLEIDDYDIEIIKLLSNGLSQEDISFQFKKNNTSPSSLSTIEKHLNKLKIQFKANNAIHLVAIAKDVGLI